MKNFILIILHLILILSVHNHKYSIFKLTSNVFFFPFPVICALFIKKKKNPIGLWPSQKMQ